MKILLVYPRFPDTFWSFRYALNFVGKKSAMPPIGLLTVAAMTPTDWEMKLIDLNTEKLLQKDILWADYIFISAMNIQKESVKKIIMECKSVNKKIVAGGPLFTMEHENFSEIDHFVLNEAEITYPQFLNDLENGHAQKYYKSDELCDVTQSPMPLWNMIKQKYYFSVGIQVTRGCPFNCDFCNVTTLFGKIPRVKTAKQIISELDSLYNSGWRRNVFIMDDNFIGNKKVLKNEILPELIKWRKNKFGIPFNTQVSINLAEDEELMNMMREAGFISVFIGIESPNKESLIECNKGQNKGDMIEKIKIIQRYGLQVQGGFIVGFDHDPLSIFKDQIDFIQNSGIVTAMVGLLQAPYKTALWNKLKKENRIIDNMTGDNCDGSTNVITKIPLEMLKEGYIKILSEIYSPEKYYKRVKTLLQNYKPPRLKPYIELDYLLAVFKSMYQIGIKSVERTHYWKLLLWTLLHKPRFFPLAVTLSIYGYHFRRVFELSAI